MKSSAVGTIPMQLGLGLLVAVGGFWSHSLLRAADEKDGPTFADPKNAGGEFAQQGEYKGTVAADDNRTWGAQVIALGKGHYRMVGFPGGLPGDGYATGDETKVAEGTRSGNTITFKMDDISIEVTTEQLKVLSNGETVGLLKRVNRESPTLGKKPPEGAIVLFDGTGADKFEGGKMSDEKLLMADTFSKEKFMDHSMHVEFRTPFRPEARGQARGNSGVYVQSRYEVQVLDSFGLSGEDNECGGIYKIAKPKVNMCYPPLAWQTYDIDFVAAKYDPDGKKTQSAKVTIRHNGVVIHNNLEISSGTPGRSPEGASAEPLYLQGHGNPVVYRNIWAVHAK